MKKDGMMVRSCNNLQVQIALFKFVVPSSLLASSSSDWLGRYLLLLGSCCSRTVVHLICLSCMVNINHHSSQQG